ncbi:MAG: methyltransferase domain-containing protein [Pseudomonadota bacterium]
MQKNRNNISSFNSAAYEEMNAWLSTPLGEKMLATERKIVEAMLSRRFGYHLLQLGCAELLLHDSSPMGHKFSFCAFPQTTTCHSAIARGDEIPLGSESVDLVLLHHALDFSDQQHQLLREVSRILIAGGHVVIVGFNPLSSWGIRNKLLWWKRQKAPWHASLLSTLRLTDWLKLLDFQVDHIKYGCYTFPVNSPAVIRYSSFMESLADRLNWPTGGIYVIVARKQVIPVTPIQLQRRHLNMHGLGMPIPDKVSQASRNILEASNEEHS